jgi:apolipoprotein D and lipocalin family protein
MRRVSTTLVSILLAVSSGAAAAAGTGAAALEPQTVASVDLARYVGTWYGIASYGDPYAEGCTDSTASYTAIGRNRILVVNQCYAGQPLRARAAVGIATVVDTASSARLTVDFGRNQGTYWIIALSPTPTDEPYEWAVVSNEDGSALFLLSRTPRLPEATRAQILASLRERGFAVERLRFTPQRYSIGSTGG